MVLITKFYLLIVGLKDGGGLYSHSTHNYVRIGLEFIDLCSREWDVTKGHSMKIKNFRNWVDVEMCFFSARGVDRWNSLYQVLVNARNKNMLDYVKVIVWSLPSSIDKMMMFTPRKYSTVHTHTHIYMYVHKPSHPTRSRIGAAPIGFHFYYIYI